MSLKPATPVLSRPPREVRPVMLDVERIRAEFPILHQEVHGKPLVYFDNAATTQKPKPVLDAIARYFKEDNANIHRAVHQLSERATRDFEEARVKVQKFLNAREAREIIFVRGTTEAINLVAQSYGRANFKPGDEVIISHMEHHSNIVPWQMICEQTGAILRVVPINEAGEFMFEEYEKLFNARTRFVSVAHLSNSLGTINPVKRIVEVAHRHRVPVLLDGAQAAPHLPVDVRELDCDFYALSGHKLYGPTGIGVLYGKASLLEAMPPYQGGGDMIASVHFTKTSYAGLPNKFEAGTPHIAGAVGLGAAIDYVQSIGLDAIAAHEDALLQYATEKVQPIEGVRLIGTARQKAGVLSFVVDDPPISALDLGTKLDLAGVAVRTGHHCCQPVMERFGVPGTVRASFAVYNTTAEIDVFVDALKEIVSHARSRAHVLSLPVVPPPEPAYPPASAKNPDEAAEELIDLFEFLGDWTERYQHIIEMGHKLPRLPDDFRVEPNRVYGCQSTVFLTARKKPGTEETLEFLAESDAELVSGLIAILEQVFSGQRASDILAFDVEKFFARMGLDQHLTLGRRNGLAAMVQRIRNLATVIVKQKHGTATGKP